MNINMMPCFPKALIFRWKGRASWAKTTMESKTEAPQADFTPSSRNPAALAAQMSFTSIQTWHIGSGWYLKPVWQRESPPKFWKLVQVHQIVDCICLNVSGVKLLEVLILGGGLSGPAIAGIAAGIPCSLLVLLLLLGVVVYLWIYCDNKRSVWCVSLFGTKSK